jgi:hypothetical protein
MSEKKNKAAVQLGKLGGAARSVAKTAAVRANGTKGGRPAHFELTDDCRELLSELLSAEIARLQRFKADDPSWSKFWSEQIANTEALAKRFDPAITIKLSKSHIIELLQLLARPVARMERDLERDFKPNKALEEKLAKTKAVAEQIDSKVTPWAPSQPSLFAHLLKEARNAL